MVEHVIRYIALNNGKPFEARPIRRQTAVQLFDAHANRGDNVGLTQCRFEVAPEQWRHLAVKLLLRRAEEPFDDNVNDVVFLEHFNCVAEVIFRGQLLQKITL